MMQNKAGGPRGWLFFLLRLLVSSSLIIYLLWMMDWPLAFDSIIRSNKLLLFIVPLITLGSFWVSALRWKAILADSQIAFPWFRAFRGYLLGVFYGTFLPGVLGGDAVRVGICVRETHCSIGTSTAAVLLERVGGVVSLFCLLFFANLVSPQILSTLLPLQDNQLISWIGMTGLSAVVIVIITRRVWIRWLPEGQISSIPGKMLRFIRISASTLATLQNRSLFIILIYCILFQIFDILITFTLSRAMGLQLPLMTFFIVLPLTYLVLMLPFSLGGLGLREGAMVFMLSRFGVAPTEAAMLSFLIYLNRVIISLWGGGFQLFETLTRHKPEQQVNFPSQS